MLDAFSLQVGKAARKKQRGGTPVQAATPSQLDLAAQVARLQKENHTLVSLISLLCCVSLTLT